jgi:glutamate formiminotransferase
VPLLECVPNVSEGRDAAVVETLARSLVERDGVRLLDVHTDAVHHRSVFTLVGDDRSLVDGVAAMCEAATRLIDLRHHRGAHPRLGAVDVVPFVPIAGATMADAVDAARRAGEAIAARAGLPVYYYASAALRADRQRLEDVRRGQFEGLGARMTAASGRPDTGPALPHPTAGAVAVGARPILVAFNMTLATTDVGIARQVARTIRASSGGLPCVKAIGLALPPRGIVQVSMNLVDYRVTPLPVVFDAVRREAELLGVGVLDSELVGLVPSAALGGRSPQALGLVDWHDGRLLDSHVVVDSAPAPDQTPQGPRRAGWAW